MGLKKIKEQNKEYNISILDLLRLLDPSKTGKFMTLLLNELKFYNKSVPLGARNIRLLNHPIKTINVVHEEVLEILIDCLGGSDVINDLEKFEVLCEENLISIKDIQEYKSLGELSLAVIDAEEKRKDKDCSPHKEIVLDHPDYLILKPLNVFASKKYGASTKWCTSSHNPETFYSYSNKGILIYVIDKKTNQKIGVYYELNTKELSWWDSEDNRVDGLMVNLPKIVKNHILEYLLTENYPNSHYFNQETKELSNKPTNEMAIININGGNQEVTVNPEPFTGVWRTDVDGPKWTPTTSEERIDELVTKTLEYHYTIDALNKGGQEMS